MITWSSFEQYYQAVRRFWRFGQVNPVRIDVIATEGLAGVVRNMRRKSAATDAMFATMISKMNDALTLKRFREHDRRQEVPAWL